MKCIQVKTLQAILDKMDKNDFFYEDELEPLCDHETFIEGGSQWSKPEKIED